MYENAKFKEMKVSELMKNKTPRQIQESRQRPIMEKAAKDHDYSVELIDGPVSVFEFNSLRKGEDQMVMIETGNTNPSAALEKARTSLSDLDYIWFDSNGKIRK